jgi:dephospho-CoA kinase
LVETGQMGRVNRVLVVDIPKPLQVERTRHRDGLSRSEVEAIINAQVSREERLAAADDVIVNDGNLDCLEKQVEQFHRYYLKLCPSV